MERIRISVLRARALAGGDAFDVFSDGGTGTLDTDNPLNDRPVRFWGGLPISAGHLLDGHLSGGHLDHVIPDGHVDGPHLLDEHLTPAAELPWTTRPLYFGARQFGVKVVNRFGNTDGTAPSAISLVVNAAPRSAEAPAKTGYDAQAQQLTLSFTPSPDL